MLRNMRFMTVIVVAVVFAMGLALTSGGPVGAQCLDYCGGDGCPGGNCACGMSLACNCGASPCYCFVYCPNGGAPQCGGSDYCINVGCQATNCVCPDVICPELPPPCEGAGPCSGQKGCYALGCQCTGDVCPTGTQPCGGEEICAGSSGGCGGQNCICWFNCKSAPVPCGGGADYCSESGCRAGNCSCADLSCRDFMPSCLAAACSAWGCQGLACSCAGTYCTQGAFPSPCGRQQQGGCGCPAASPPNHCSCLSSLICEPNPCDTGSCECGGSDCGDSGCAVRGSTLCGGKCTHSVDCLCGEYQGCNRCGQVCPNHDPHPCSYPCTGWCDGNWPCYNICGTCHNRNERKCRTACTPTFYCNRSLACGGADNMTCSDGRCCGGLEDCTDMIYMTCDCPGTEGENSFCYCGTVTARQCTGCDQ